MINWFDKHITISWLITIIITGIIFYLSSLTFPSGGTPTTNFFSILYHFLAFFFLALFLLISLIQGRINQTLLITGILIAIIYSISDEIHQYFVPGRASSISDILINTAGILTSSIIYSIHCINCNNKKKKDRIIF